MVDFFCSRLFVCFVLECGFWTWRCLCFYISFERPCVVEIWKNEIDFLIVFWKQLPYVWNQLADHFISPLYLL